MHEVLGSSKEIILYGYGQYGRVIKSYLDSTYPRLKIIIVDDKLKGEGIQKLADIKNKAIPVIITAFEVNAIALMREKCVKLGFVNLCSDKAWLASLKEAQQGIGYEKASGRVRQGLCPLCGSDAKEIYVTAIEEFVFQCQVCSHVFKEGYGSFVDVEMLYSDISYYHRNPFSSSDREKLRPQIDARLKVLLDAGVRVDSEEALHILEVGCLEGVLLHELKQLGHRVKGCEVNVPALEIGVQEFGLEIVSEDIAKKPFADDSFDVICSFHVLEHLVDPKSAMKACKDMLKKGGTVVMSLPMDEDDYENIEHLHFFTQKSMALLLEEIFGNGEVKIGSPYYVGNTRYFTMDAKAVKL